MILKNKVLFSFCTQNCTASVLQTKDEFKLIGSFNRWTSEIFFFMNIERKFLKQVTLLYIVLELAFIIFVAMKYNK